MERQPPARPLYDRLQKIRIDNGWSHIQLAERAGIARGTIDNWKRQPRPPLPVTVKGVAARLGIDYDEALALAGIVRSSDNGSAEAAGAENPEVRPEGAGAVPGSSRLINISEPGGDELMYISWHGPGEPPPIEELRRRAQERLRKLDPEEVWAEQQRIAGVQDDKEEPTASEDQ